MVLVTTAALVGLLILLTSVTALTDFSEINVKFILAILIPVTTMEDAFRMEPIFTVLVVLDFQVQIVRTPLVPLTPVLMEENAPFRIPDSFTQQALFIANARLDF